MVQVICSYTCHYSRIFLFTSIDKIPQGEPLVVQEYLDKVLAGYHNY